MRIHPIEAVLVTLKVSFFEQHPSHFTRRVVYLKKHSIWWKLAAVFFELCRNQLRIQKYM